MSIGYITMFAIPEIMPIIPKILPAIALPPALTPHSRANLLAVLECDCARAPKTMASITGTKNKEKHDKIIDAIPLPSAALAYLSILFLRFHRLWSKFFPKPLNSRQCFEFH